ncbi:LytTR family DNA-binding domain-containing protein [Bowmanella dokdonensis]
MDVVFHVPRTRLRAGENDLVLLISGHHSLLELVAPIHAINFAPYRQPTDYLMSQYWQSYAVLGALVLACIYLGALAWRSAPSMAIWTLALMTLFSAAQLLFEVWRATEPYSYPFHDIRLLLILACSVGFALALLSHLLDRFSGRQRWKTWLGCSLLILGGGLTRTGFDSKSSMSILIACGLGAGLCAYWRWRGNRQATLPALVLTGYILALVFSPSRFLDAWFYFLNAAFLLFFASVQAASFAIEQRLRQREQQRAERLQLALDRLAQDQSPQSLSISSAGQLHTLDTRELEYCKSDRDYVEFVPIQGKPMLDSNTSLGQLEAALPSTFLRVHRSFIVNTSQIRALERDTNGTGRLILASGRHVPVSRRIMPSVRKVLA